MLTPDDILIGNFVREQKLVPDEVLNSCKAVLESGEGGSLARLLAEKGHLSAASTAKVLEAQRMNPESRRLNTPEMIEDFIFVRVAVAAGKISREDANGLLIEQNERIIAGKMQRLAEIAGENLLINPADMPELLSKARRAFVLCGECLVPLDATVFPPGAKIQCPTCRSGITIPSEITVVEEDFGESLSGKIPGELPLTILAVEVEIENVADALAAAASADPEAPPAVAGDKTTSADLTPADLETAADSAHDAPTRIDASAPPMRSRPKTAMIKPRTDMLSAVAQAPPKSSRKEKKASAKKPATKREKKPSVRERPSTRPAVEKPLRAPITVRKTSWTLTCLAVIIAVAGGIALVAYVLPPDLYGLKPEAGKAGGLGIKKILIGSQAEDSKLLVDGKASDGIPFTPEFKKKGSEVGLEAEGFVPANLTVKLEKDTLKLDFALRPDTGVSLDEGFIRVIAEPSGANLTIDGSGAQSGRDRKTLVGTHEVIVSASGYKTHSQSVDIGPGEKVVLYVALAPESGKPEPVVKAIPPTSLAFTTNPPGAVVELFIPGAEPERYTSPFVRTGLSEDTYFVNLHAPGCFDRQMKVEVVSGQTKSVRVSLSRRLLWSAPVGAGAFAPSIVDWDGDGVVELVAASAEGRTSILAGVDGYAVESVRTGRVTAPAVAGDLNGDGKAELVVATYDDALAAYGSSGTRLWQAAAGGTVSGTPLLFDLNGDGSLDVVFGSWGGIAGVVSGSDGKTLSTVEHKSGFGIAPALIKGDPASVYFADVRGIVRRYDWAYGKLQEVWKRSLAPSSVMPVGIVPADVNGDLYPDIVIATNHGLVAALDARTGKAYWQADAGGRITHGPVAGDVRGDGGAEVAVVVDGRRIVILSGSDGKSLASETPARGRVVGLVLADISGSGKSSILLSMAGHASDSGVAVVKGEGSFDCHLLPTPAEPVGVPAVADINGDGVADLAVPLADGSVSLISVSPGNVLWRSHFGAPAGAPLTRTSGERLEVGLLAATGGLVWFDAESGLPTSIQTDFPGGHWSACDLNGDGVTDAVVSLSGSVKAFDGKSGQRLWEHAVEGEGVAAGPPACAESGGGFVVVYGESSGILRALSGDSGSEKWKIDGETAHMAAPVAINVRGDDSQEILCVTREHGLVCVDTAAGEVAWSTNVAGEPVGSPSVFRSGADLVMVAYSTEEKIYLVEGGRGDALRTIQESDRITSPPTLADLNGNGIPEILYTTARSTLLARSTDGRKIWTRPVRGFSRVPVLVSGTGRDKTVLSLDARGRLDAFAGGGKPKWMYGRRAVSAYVNPVMAVLPGSVEGVALVTDRGVELLGPKMRANAVRWSHDAAQVWK